VVITVDASGNDSSWNEFRYSVYAVGQLVQSTDMDGDGMADTWEVASFNNLVSCAPGADPDTDGFCNRDEYICLTDPRDLESYFSIKRTESGAGDGYEFYVSTETAPAAERELINTRKGKARPSYPKALTMEYSPLVEAPYRRWCGW